MKRFGSQLHKKAQSIKLSAAERADLRARLVSYMEYHPLPKETKATIPERTLVSEPYTAIRINYTYLSSLVGVMAVFVLVIVPVVAEKTVPGDVLYPVKVQFNEELRSSLSFSPYAKVEWETKRLERRLAEARLLADEGRLTQEVEAGVVEAVQAHSEAAQEEIEVIRATDSDEAVIAELAFASALEVQSEVLASREETDEETGQSVASLAGVVADARNAVEASQETANPSYEKLLARLELETTSAQELFTSIQTSASADEVTDIERRFEDIKRKIEESRTLYEAIMAMDESDTGEADEEEDDDEPTARELEREAKQLLKDALIDTRKLVSFMTDIDVRTNVAIEDLVPVTLTEEEKRRALEVRLNQLAIASEDLDRVVVDEALEEKFAFGKASFTDIHETARTALADGEIEATTNLLTEAEALVADLLQMGEVTLLIPSEEEAASTTEAVIEAVEIATSTPTTTEETTQEEEMTEEGETEGDEVVGETVN